MHCRNYRLLEDLEGVGLADVAHADQGVVYAYVSERGEPVYGLLSRHRAVAAVLCDRNAAQAGLFDLLVGTALVLTVALEHFKLVLDPPFIEAGEEVAGIAVLGHEA